nr:MAG TPA: Cadmium carbonic anhydrase repeat protein [Caudoviricetes sp.]
MSSVCFYILFILLNNVDDVLFIVDIWRTH